MALTRLCVHAWLCLLLPACLVGVQWGFHSLGHVEVYDDLLKAARVEGAPEVRWVKIGTEADG